MGHEPHIDSEQQKAFFEELTFTWGINEVVPATKMRKNKGEIGIPGSEK